jgi:hypothetical protein
MARQRPWTSGVAGIVTFLFVIFVVYGSVPKGAQPWVWLGVVLAAVAGLVAFGAMMACGAPLLFRLLAARPATFAPLASSEPVS